MANATDILELRALKAIFSGHVAANDFQGAGDITLHLTTGSDSTDSTSATAIPTSGSNCWTNYSPYTLTDHSAGTGSDKMTLATVGGVTTAKNTLEISFGVAAITGTLPDITGILIKGNLGTGGGDSDVLFWGGLAVDKAVTNGDTFKFAADALVITID